MSENDLVATDTNVGGNLIDRQAAIDALGERPTVWTDDDDYALGERNQYDMDRLAIETVPSAQLAQDLTNGCTDTISRQAAIDAINRLDIPEDMCVFEILSHIELEIGNLPSAQPGQRNARVFQGIVVEYPSISAYPEYEGKPYFSIKYTENGQEFIGYGTYKPEVLSEYLKEYFMPPTQPVVISKLENATECEDAVSREAVLNEIHRYMEERDYTIGLLDDNVCGLPPVTPKQPGWIPWNSGKFPEESGTYTVTAYDGATKRVTYAKYQKRLKRWKLTGARAYWRVLAWMPLPTPWEGEKDDG